MDNGDDGNGIGSVVANNFAFAGCVGSGNEHTEGGDTDTAASRWTFVDLNICFTRLVNATATVDAEGAPPSAPLPLLAMPPPPVSARASSNGKQFLLLLALLSVPFTRPSALLAEGEYCG